MAEPSSTDSTPTVVILHGLTGGSNESYVRNAIAQLIKSREEGGAGVRCVVVNFRGCAQTPLTSPQLYSACKVTDLESALLLLTRMFPQSPMVGLGFSLGGSILTRYMGLTGKNTPLIGAIPVGAPFDLSKSSASLESTSLNRIYAKVLGSSLYKMAQRHADVLALSPDLWEPLELIFRTKIDPDASKPVAKPTFESPQYCTLRFVDHVMTRVAGGLPTPYGDFPFSSAEEYYKSSSPQNTLANIARPLLALSADDDPIVPLETLEAAITGVKKNQNLVLAHSQCGGHLGWFAGPRGERWIKHPITEFVCALCDAHAASKVNALGKGLGTGGPQASAWRWRSIDQRSVQVEVLPKSQVPSVLPQSLRAAPEPDNELSNELVLLRSQVLPHLPLRHPNDSPAKRQDIPKGRMLSLSLVCTRICGYCGWHSFIRLTRDLPQHSDSIRPEVGFIELPDNVRVGTYIYHLVICRAFLMRTAGNGCLVHNLEMSRIPRVDTEASDARPDHSQ